LKPQAASPRHFFPTPAQFAAGETVMGVIVISVARLWKTAIVKTLGNGIENVGHRISLNQGVQR